MAYTDIMRSLGKFCEERVLLASDAGLNPGPAKFPCGACCKAVRCNHKGINFDACSRWFHAKCEYVNDSLYCQLANSTTGSNFRFNMA